MNLCLLVSDEVMVVVVLQEKRFLLLLWGVLELVVDPH